MMNKISAKVVADSITMGGNRLAALEVVMPRFILAEFNTHRMFSRNSASSRAIPFKRMVKSVQENPFIPYAWQKDHSGMQGTEYFTDPNDIETLVNNHLMARDQAVAFSSLQHSLGVTKQLVNRLLEPYMYHKVLVSATEWENFFNLRSPQYRKIDEKGKKTLYKSKVDWLKDASVEDQTELGKRLIKNPYAWFGLNEGQGEIHIMEVAECIWDAMNESKPKQLKSGEWHIPYGDNFDIEMMATIAPNETTWLTMIKIATARAARLSYQTLGENPKIDYAADIKLHDDLLKSGHLSPFEHCARAMEPEEYELNVKGKLEWTTGQYAKPLPTNSSEGWSNNFRGFMQYRAIIENNFKEQG